MAKGKNPTFKQAMAKAKKGWKKAQKRVEDNPGFVEVEDGRYKATIEKMELGQSKSSGRLQCSITYKILEGEYKGQRVFDHQGLDSEDNLYYFGLLLAKFGYELPENFEDIEDILEAIVKDEPVVRITVKTNGDFTNTRLNKVLDEEADEESDEESDEEDDDEESEEEDEEDDEEDEEDEEEEEVPCPECKGKGKKGKKKCKACNGTGVVQPEEEEDEEDEEEDEVEEETTVPKKAKKKPADQEITEGMKVSFEDDDEGTIEGVVTNVDEDEGYTIETEDEDEYVIEDASDLTIIGDTDEDEEGDEEDDDEDEDEIELEEGMKIKFDLKGKKKTGTIKKLDEKTGKVHIKGKDGKVVKIKPEDILEVK